MNEPAVPPEPAPDGTTDGATVDRRIAWLRRGVWVVLLAGVVSFLVRGADNPDDPTLGAAAAADAAGQSRVSTNDGGATTTTTSLVPPAVDDVGTSTTSAASPTSSAEPGSPSPARRSSPTLPGDPEPAPTVLVPVPGTDPGPVAEPVGDPNRRPLEGFPEVVFRVTAVDGGTFDGMAMLADHPDSHRQGLMEQTDLRGYDAMVFRFQTPNTGGFYMRNTRIPLSIAFFDVNGRFISSADMEPCPDIQLECPTTRAAGPYFHAIEVAQGDLQRLGIGEGSVLSFPSP